ncbi:alpha/beta hydrolase [Aliiroseovarius crassostreae]|uniref:alpha/beta hydrolase n=1 Tax=Aliiroseovarius crassostreae TaxID=154981 RepID=UPI00220494E0|nr:alpha/beta hydrolase [Aliiroseovarius crassostreae]UWP98437.1 alpha/beta hydrolase [Aliiroseovarius crassostreae]
MDYENIIDAETWAFIRKTEDYYPPDAIDLTIAEQRSIYDRMCRAFFEGYPEGVSAHDAMADGVPVRIYEAAPASGTVVYFHGGGFVVGGLESHDDVCAEICARTGLRVVSADYRLCPEHTHPAAYEDALSVARYASLTWPGVTVLAGDSAGGNLAAAVAHTLRREVPLAGLVMIYPGLGGDMTKGSYLAHASAPMLTLEDVKFYATLRHGTQDFPDDPTASPLRDQDFADLPPTYVVAAQCDPLSDDGRAYCDAVRDAGGRAVWREEEGLVHGYLRARTSVARAGRSFDRIIAVLTAFSQGKWPF